MFPSLLLPMKTSIYILAYFEKEFKRKGIRSSYRKTKIARRISKCDVMCKRVVTKDSEALEDKKPGNNLRKSREQECCLLSTAKTDFICNSW